MTIPEFLERLRKIEARWELLDGCDIRCEQGDCPITRVATEDTHEPFSPDTWEEAAAALDMEFDDAQAIVDAADLVSEYDSALRTQLLAATVNRT